MHKKGGGDADERGRLRGRGEGVVSHVGHSRPRCSVAVPPGIAIRAERT